jgi:methylthioribulose-1-phosphate dehydratase
VPDFPEIASQLATTAKSFHTRGWLLGTSGNLSAVIQREPLRLAMSPSGIDKGELSAQQVLTIDESGQIVSDHALSDHVLSDHLPSDRVLSSHPAKPSDETLLHLRIVKERGAGAVLHTHSVWNTMLSDFYANERGVKIEGYEMLKGLQGIKTHDHTEWLPIIDNSQDMPALANTIASTLKQHPSAHGFLLKRHGLYSWGDNLSQAKRHIEILEFLLETLGRTLLVTNHRK